MYRSFKVDENKMSMFQGLFFDVKELCDPLESGFMSSYIFVEDLEQYVAIHFGHYQKNE